MSTKKKTFLFLLLSMVGFGIGFILTNSLSFGFCIHDQYSCRELLNNIGDPLFYGMPALAIVFLLLLIFPQSLPAWKKFAKWFIPIAALIFIFYNGPSSGDLFSPYPEQVFRWISILYVVVSILIIVMNFFKQRKSTT